MFEKVFFKVNLVKDWFYKFLWEVLEDLKLIDDELDLEEEVVLEEVVKY